MKFKLQIFWQESGMMLKVCIFGVLTIAILAITIFEFFLFFIILALLMIAAVIFGGIQNGVYILLLFMPLVPSIEIAEIQGRIVGITIEYAMIVLIVILWVIEKLLTNDYTIKTSRSVVLFALFIVITSFSIIKASISLGLNGIFNGLLPYIGLLEHFLLYLIIYNEFQNRRQIETAIKFLVFGASLAITVNLIVHIIEGGDAWRMQSVFDSLVRKDEVVNNPNSYASYVMILVFLGFAYIGKKFGNARYVLFIVMVLGIITIVLSGSRSVLLAVVAGAIVYAIMNKRIMPVFLLTILAPLTLLYEQNYDRIISIGEILFSKKVFMIFSKIDYSQINWDQIQVSGYEGYGTNIVSGALRFVHWTEGISMIRERPIFGYGYHLIDKYSFSATSENYFLDIWVMTGIFGLLIILLLFHNMAKSANYLRHSNDVYISRYGVFFTIYLVAVIVICMTGSVLFSAKVATYFWVLSGFLNSLTNYEKDTLSIT
jgi:hypothetical protein|tara:strand:- start:250 stop:1710 length:1461 start_codon:yes stop_codon:yes gene_type:complete